MRHEYRFDESGITLDGEASTQIFRLAQPHLRLSRFRRIRIANPEVSKSGLAIRDPILACFAVRQHELNGRSGWILRG